MRFMCYTDTAQREPAIRIELTGATLPTKKWQFVRDSAKDVFSSAYWAKALRFPKGRIIIIALKETPNKKSWKAITERWLNVLETREIVPARFADDGVLFKKDDGKLEMTREELPVFVSDKLQTAFWKECEEMLDIAKEVAKLEERYKSAKRTLDRAREELRNFAGYLDSQDLECDDSKITVDTTGDSWIEMAIGCGALEE